MRVLRISHSAVVDEWRGRERAISARGVDVTLLSARDWPEGGAVVTLTPRADETVTGIRTAGRHPALFVYDPRPIWRALDEHWDVIDIHEEPFALATAEILLLRALRGARTPVVLYTAQNLRKRYPLPFRWLERRALLSAAGISACNSDAARIAEDKGFPGRARVIPLGIDERRFHPAPGVPEGDRDEQPRPTRIVVGFAGRFVPEKGLGVALDALALDGGLHLRLAGAGPMKAELRSRASEIGVAERIEFVGSVGTSEIADFYRSLDVLAVPSLPTPSWTEQFGRVAIEAMACGIPVVSSDAGALPDVVGGAGLIVPAGDAGALASALVEAAGPRAAELRRLGAARAASCTWDAVGDAYVDLYRSVIHGQRNAPEDGPSLEVIVVAYGAIELLRRAIEPLGSLPLTVVDNSSLPEIAALCTELGVRYVDPGRNGGFAAGVNTALRDRLVPGADVLLLNPDAEVSASDVERLHQALRARPDLASVGPAQVDERGVPAQVEWRYPSPASTWLGAAGLSRLHRGARFVIGSVLLLRAEAIEQVGEFDERYFLYSEETDWAYRARLLGWRHAVVPEVTAVHAGAATSGDSVRREAHFHASLERYLRKHHGAAGWQAARVGQWLGSMARAALLRGERAREARRRAALYRLGPARVEARFLASPAPTIGPRTDATLHHADHLAGAPAGPRTGGDLP